MLRNPQEVDRRPPRANGKVAGCQFANPALQNESLRFTLNR